MAYIYENTNTVRIKFTKASNSAITVTYDFDANCEFDLEENSKTYETWNHELVVDDIGSRMNLTVSINNRSNINTQSNVRGLLSFINLVKGGIYNVTVWPSYDSTMEEYSLDSFDCVVVNRYDVKKLHQFIKAGNNITIKFREKIPNVSYSPKIPVEIETTFTTPPFGVGGNLIG